MRQILKHYLSKENRQKLLRLERTLKLFTSPRVLKDWYDYRKMNEVVADDRFTTDLKDIFPISGENTKYTSFDRHYVYHTAWAVRAVKEIKEASQNSKTFKHIDISSSLYFSGLLSAFIPVDFYDYRPADLRLSGLATMHGDLMDLPFEDNTVESISCLHTIEHVGLGRYGDPIDPLGDTKAIKQLMRVVAPGGNLLIVVPVGKQRIEFNAHRIYSPSYIRDLICQAGEFELSEYAFIPETDREGGLERGTSIIKGQNSMYACGCFWFKKIHKTESAPEQKIDVKNSDEATADENTIDGVTFIPETEVKPLFEDNKNSADSATGETSDSDDSAGNTNNSSNSSSEERI